MDGWRDMAISQLPTWGGVSYQLWRTSGRTGELGGAQGGDINEMYPNQLCVAPQPSRRHLIM